MTEKKTLLESVAESAKHIKMRKGDVEDVINNLMHFMLNAICEETEKRLAALEEIVGQLKETHAVTHCFVTVPTPEGYGKRISINDFLTMANKMPTGDEPLPDNAPLARRVNHYIQSSMACPTAKSLILELQSLYWRQTKEQKQA